jgi:hypothetical protein
MFFSQQVSFQNKNNLAPDTIFFFFFFLKKSERVEKTHMFIFFLKRKKGRVTLYQ